MLMIAKMMIISMEAGMVRKEEKFPHSLCGKGVGTYSISYQFWKILICKRCIFALELDCNIMMSFYIVFTQVRK